MAVEISLGLPMNSRILKDEETVTPEPVEYHPLHDLESMWWVGAWTLMNHVSTAYLDDSSHTDKLGLLEQKAMTLGMMFPSREPRGPRHRYFDLNGQFQATAGREIDPNLLALGIPLGYIRNIFYRCMHSQTRC